MRAGPVLSKSLCEGQASAPCPVERRKFVLAVAVLGSSLGFIDGTIITVAVHSIRTALDAGFAQVLWVVNGYTLALAAFLLVGGAAGDRFGKRRIFGIGIVVFAVASLFCGLAPNVEALIAARVVQGLGAALLVPGSLALIAVNYPPEERGAAVGIWAAASGITSALGPILGGMLIDLGSWRFVFLINVPVAALTLALLYARVPRDLPSSQRQFDVAGAVLAFLAIGFAAGGFTLAEVVGLSDPRAIGLIAGGIAGVGAFVFWQARAAAPMMPLEMFRSRTFSIANLLTLFVYFALGGVLFFLPVTLMTAKGWSATEAGAIFLPFTAAMALVSPYAGRLADRFGARNLLFVGALVVTLALILKSVALPHAESFVIIVFPMLCFGFGMGLAIPPLSAAILNGVDSARTGIASGVNNAVARVAGLLAVAILGLFASLFYRTLLGVEGTSFAADTPADAATEAAATILVFQVISVGCAALTLLAAGLSRLLPRAMPAAAAPA